MNQIFTSDNEKIYDQDAQEFYSLISSFINQKLDPSKDEIVLSKPDWVSKNVGNTVLCKINKIRFVALKKSVPELKIRRELLISEIKKQMGFPTYNIAKITNLKLRRIRFLKKKNCKLLDGWNNKSILIIDFGNYKKSKTLLNLTINEINDIQSFCKEYGRLAAFNFLFGVMDRNSSNFVFFLDSQSLQSIDNEAWPFHPKGDELGEFMIIDRTRFTIEKFIDVFNRDKIIKYLRDGFMDGWKLVSEDLSFLNKLNKKEEKMFQKRFSKNSNNIASDIFSDKKIVRIKWWKKGANWWDSIEGKKFLSQHGINE